MGTDNNDRRDEPVQATFSLDAAMATIVRLEGKLSERRLKVHSGTALGSLFAMVRRLAGEKPLNDKRWRVTFLRANEAVRLAHAIEAALDDAGAKEAIHRVTDSDVNLATRQESQGKDALWELDLYRRFQLGGVPVRFEEPDLVVSLGDDLGDYAVACKKLYSEKNFANLFKGGCEQIDRHGRPGIVAFNLDDLVPTGDVWTEPTERALRRRLDDWNAAFLKGNEVHFRAALGCGECDGVLVSTSVISEVTDMAPPINVTRSTAIWNHGTGRDAQVRLNAFRERLDMALERLAESE